MLTQLAFGIAHLALAAWVYKYVYREELVDRVGMAHIEPAQFNDTVATLNYELQVLIARINTPDPERDVDFRTMFDIDSRRDLVVGCVFAFTISSSILLIVLMMCEIGDMLLAENTRLGLFQYTIAMLVMLLIFAIPFFIASLLVTNELVPSVAPKHYRSAGLTALALITWLWVLHRCGEISLDFSTGARSLVETKVNEIAVAGITILAILSGIGSTLTPYKLFALDHRLVAAIRRWQHKPELVPVAPASPAHINQLVATYNSTVALWSKRRHQLTHGERESARDENPEFSPHRQRDKSRDAILRQLPSFLNRVHSFALLSGLVGAQSEEEDLAREVEALAQVRDRTYEELSRAVERLRLRQARRHEQFAHAVLRYANLAFAAYCVYRIVAVLFFRVPLFVFSDNRIQINSAVITDHDASPEPRAHKDALATTVAHVLIAVYPTWGVLEQQLTSQLGFIFLGSLFVCLMSNVVVTFRSFARILPNSTRHYKNVKKWLKHFFVGELLGVYTMATALMIRTNLPATLLTQISRLLSLLGGALSRVASGREVEFIDRWFDSIFALSCVVTAVSIVAKKWWEDDEYDEEMGVE